MAEITQFIVGQVGSSCAEPSWWHLSIIIGLVTASGVVLVSTGVGLVGIATTATTMVGLIMTGASLDSVAAALGVHLTIVGGSLEILGGLIIAIKGGSRMLTNQLTSIRETVIGLNEFSTDIYEQ